MHAVSAYHELQPLWQAALHNVCQQIAVGADPAQQKQQRTNDKHMTWYDVTQHNMHMTGTSHTACAAPHLC